MTARRLLLQGALAIGMAMGLSACGLGGPAYAPPGPEVAAAVQMTNNFTFEPPTVTVRAGELVEWRNKSVFGHTVTGDPARAARPERVSLPAGAQAFHSGPIPAGEIYRMRFTVPGTYRYVCLPHEGQGMAGTVVVTP